MNTTAHAEALLASTFSRSLEQNLQRHRAYVENLGAQAVRDGAATGFIDVEGQGECTANISFPVRFLEKPVFSFGLELAENVWLQWGSFPEYSVTVGAWTTEPADGEPLYVGALLGIFVAGVDRSIVHYRFTGRSLTNAGRASMNIGAVL